MAVRIYITGAFKVLGDGGVDITPKGSKEKALLALLATSVHGTRARKWLKGLLWSTREQHQAAGSLRQATVKIRRSLGDAAKALTSTRYDLCLDLNAFEVIADPSREFLEGLDVKDDNFRAWLHAERVARSGGKTAAKDLICLTHARPISLAPPLCLQVKIESHATDDYGWLARSIADTVTKSLRENFSLPVVAQTRISSGLSSAVSKAARCSCRITRTFAG